MVCFLRWRNPPGVPWATSLPSLRNADPVAERLDLAEMSMKEMAYRVPWQPSRIP